MVGQNVARQRPTEAGDDTTVSILRVIVVPHALLTVTATRKRRKKSRKKKGKKIDKEREREREREKKKNEERTEPRRKKNEDAEVVHSVLELPLAKYLSTTQS